MNLLIAGIYGAQREFMFGAAEISSYSMQKAGDASLLFGYAAMSTVAGAEVGVPFVVLGNAMKYAGLGMEIGIDVARGNKSRATYSTFTNGLMYGVSEIGRVAPGPSGAIFNLILVPFDYTLGKGKEIIKTNR